MPSWFDYKAKPYDAAKNKNRRSKIQQRRCRICGKPTTGGTLCQSCRSRKKQTGKDRLPSDPEADGGSSPLP